MLKNPVAKKTKKEKLLADKRRLLALVSEQRKTPAETIFASQSPRMNVFSFKSSSTVTDANRQLEQPKGSYDYVTSDLRKIFVLTAFAICAQVVLWYLLEKQLISLF